MTSTHWSCVAASKAAGLQRNDADRKCGCMRTTTATPLVPLNPHAFPGAIVTYMVQLLMLFSSLRLHPRTAAHVRPHTCCAPSALTMPPVSGVPNALTRSACVWSREGAGGARGGGERSSLLPLGVAHALVNKIPRPPPHAPSVLTPHGSHTASSQPSTPAVKAGPNAATSSAVKAGPSCSTMPWTASGPAPGGRARQS